MATPLASFPINWGAIIGASPEAVHREWIKPDLGLSAWRGRAASSKPTLTSHVPNGEATDNGSSQMPKPTLCSAVYPTLAVPSVEDACNWYVEKLGFAVRFLWGEPPTHGAISLGDACIHFWHGVPQLGENWLYFDITGLDAMYERAKARGVEITRAPENYPWGMREFNATDLNGYKIRFGQNLGEQG